MNSILLKLRNLKSRATELIGTGADGIDGFADLLKEVEDTAREIAATLRRANVATADETKARDELKAMKADLESPSVQADSPFADLLKKVLAALIAEFLKNKFPN